MKLWWRTRPSADEYVDITDSTRIMAIREALYQASVDESSRILRISGKPGRKGRSIPAVFELPGTPQKSDR